MTAVIDPVIATVIATVAGMTSVLSVVCCPVRRSSVMRAVRRLVFSRHRMMLMSLRRIDAA